MQTVKVTRSEEDSPNNCVTYDDWARFFTKDSQGVRRRAARRSSARARRAGGESFVDAGQRQIATDNAHAKQANARAVF